MNVVKYYEHVYAEEEDADYLVYELCKGGTLNDLINNQGKMKEVDIKRLFEQMVAAVVAMEELGVVHRDIKPHNIFLTEPSVRGTIKFGDMGTARYMDEKGYLALEMMVLMGTTIVQSMYYASP